MIKKIYDNIDKIRKCQEVQLNKYQVNTDVIKIRMYPSLKADVIEINGNDKEYIDIVGKPFKGSVVDGNDEWVMVEKKGRVGFVNAKDNYYLDLPFSGSQKISQGNNGSCSHFNHKTWDNTYAIDVAMNYEEVLAPTDGTIVRLYDESHNGTGTCAKGTDCCIGGGRVLVMQDQHGNYINFQHLNSFNVRDC